MKKFWNYIFYFTWNLHRIIGMNIVKPLKKVLILIPFFAKNFEKTGKNYRDVLDNSEYGFHIGFAFHCMLVSGFMIFACIFSNFIILFDIDMHKNFRIEMFFSFVLLLSYLFNEFLLGWHKKTYQKYFQEFQGSTNHFRGNIITLCFHLGVVLIGVLMIIISR